MLNCIDSLKIRARGAPRELEGQATSRIDGSGAPSGSYGSLSSPMVPDGALWFSRSPAAFLFMPDDPDDEAPPPDTAAEKPFTFLQHAQREKPHPFTWLVAGNSGSAFAWEFLGTMILCFSAQTSDKTPLVLGAIVYFTGGHVNPSVTIALAITGNLPEGKAMFMILGLYPLLQIMGGLVGMMLAHGIKPYVEDDKNKFVAAGEGAAAGAFCVREIFGTMLLLLMVGIVLPRRSLIFNRL